MKKTYNLGKIAFVSFLLAMLASYFMSTLTGAASTVLACAALVCGGIFAVSIGSLITMEEKHAPAGHKAH